MSAAAVTTRAGDRVNQFSGLCGRCSNLAAQTAIFITDDAEWDYYPVPDASLSLDAYRWQLIQQRMTEYRADCVRLCGRSEQPSEDRATVKR